MNDKLNSKTPRKLLFIFEILSLSLIFLYSWEGIQTETYTIAIGLVVLIYFSNFILSKISSGDNYIFLIVSMLISIGIIMIYRISPELGLRQLMWLTVGITMFFAAYFAIRYIGFWEKLAPLYLAACYILFAVTFVMGTRTHGAINWISIAGISIQPAEITKIIVVFLLASFYGGIERYRKIKNAELFLMGIMYSFIALLFLQRDLGAAVIFFGIFTGLQYIYSEDRRLIWANVGLSMMGAVSGYMLFDHVKVRVVTWLDPWPHINDKGYQITQSLFAIAEGGFFGTGLGRGNPSFIPLSYNDFIFSAISEEMGIFTGIGIIMLFMLLVYRGFKIALRQDSQFYRIIALGISLMFGIQSFVIIGGVLKVIPLTGLTLPFVSYGGTSAVTSFIALGILQGASEKRGKAGKSNE
ncbi:FtsW/RodA/SpoVE family cell cycle protein [Gudongella sp. DL1XJH-153]|uniref:FtsW/RodA/SpoVE family cell cycle protein n=1 Tax=Gudongella sp. DL1XJH-153 TaxID=3409804 RepID=UPI003BB4A8A2